MSNGPISASGLHRNPQNIYIYSCGYDTAPSLTSNPFPIFEMVSTKGPKRMSVFPCCSLVCKFKWFRTAVLNCAFLTISSYPVKKGAVFVNPVRITKQTSVAIQKGRMPRNQTQSDATNGITNHLRNDIQFS